MPISSTNQPRTELPENRAALRTDLLDSLPASSTFIVGQTEATGPVRSIPIVDVPFCVGRGSEADLRLNFDSVSRLHAQFHLQDGVLGISDFGSTNGTFLNGDAVQGFRPLHENDLVQFGRAIFRVHRNAAEIDHHTEVEDVADWALTLTQFDKLMSDDAVVPHYQAIVDLHDLQVAGYEVLARSCLFGLYGADLMFAAASQFKQECELSRMMRAVGMAQGMMLSTQVPLFLNTHPRELEDIESLVKSLEHVRQLAAHREITLEIHEAAATDLEMLHHLRKTMQDLNIGLAFDDFGCGQSRLLELVEVKPDILKFDIKLVKDVHLASDEQQQMVAKLVRISQDLGIKSIAEGVESVQNAEVCRQLGFDLAQGYFFGRPTDIYELLSLEDGT